MKLSAIRVLIFLCVLCASALDARAQTLVTVTGTITDPNGLAYTGARVTVALAVPPPGSPSLTPCPSGQGCPFSNPAAFSTDPKNGSFTINLWANASITPAGSTYSFHVDSFSAQVPPPVGTGPQSFDVTGVTIIGPGPQSLSATLSAAAPALTNIAGGGGGGGFANRTLSNLLNPTAINQNLIPGAGGLTLGTTANPFADTNTNAVDVFGSPGQGIQFQEGTLNAGDCSATLTNAIGSDQTTHWLNLCSNAFNSGNYSPATTTLTSSGAPVVTGQFFSLDIDTTNHAFYFWSGAAWISLSVALQTNGTNNSSQSALNFQTSTANSVGLTVTPSNPSAGNEKMEVTGGSYTGNAATSSALAATPTNCGAGLAATGVAANGNAVGCFTPAGGIVSAPQGRLTLTSGSPVMTADATAQTTVFYDSYVGQIVPIFNGTSWTTLTITANEVSMGLDATIPHIASGSLYDIFAVNSSGLVICAGPAWSTTTSRGTGAGTTQIHRQSASGLWTNQNALTNCWGGASGLTNFGSVAVDQATYLGTLDATANGQTGMQFKPAAAAGGSNNILGLYNGYNRVGTNSISRDSTASWSYSSTTWRAADGSNSNRVSFIDGLQQSPVVATAINGFAISTGAPAPSNGTDIDSTSAAPGVTATSEPTTGGLASNTSLENFAPVLGFHFAQMMEVNNTSGTYFSFGAATSPTSQRNALIIELPM